MAYSGGQVRPIMPQQWREKVGRAILCTPLPADDPGPACRGLPALSSMTEALPLYKVSRGAAGYSKSGVPSQCHLKYSPILPEISPLGGRHTAANRSA